MMRILALVVIMFLSAPAHAQIAPYVLTGLERELTLTISPTYPQPGQTMLLSVETRAMDLSRAIITWYANDEAIAQDLGLTEAVVVAKPTGEETRILVVAQDDAGRIASTEGVIRPAEIDILWEALSYTHPFYEGRPLPGSGSPLRAYALARFPAADGSFLPDEDIVYTWYRNNAVVAEGRGEAVIFIEGPQLFATDELRVVAQPVDQSFTGEARATVPSTDPFVLLYEHHPLFGILYHRALQGDVNTLENEQKITAVPYFASIASPHAPNLLYDWQVDDEAIAADPAEPQTIIITTNGYVGPADVTLNLTSFSDILLNAVSGIRLVFGERGSFFTGINPFGGSQ